MSRLTLDQAKTHLSVSDGFTAHDGLIQSYIDAAEGWVIAHVRRDLDADYPDGWPEPILQAVRFLVGHYYANREAVATGTIATEIPMSVKDLLASERDMGA